MKTITYNKLVRDRMSKNIIGSSLMITTVSTYSWKWLNKWI